MAGRKAIKGRPATTVEGRENQLVSLAISLAEQQLADGTASAQVITHYLKLGSTREALEQERIAGENQLVKAKIDHLATAVKVEELYGEAIKAMRRYRGEEDEEDYDE